MRQKFLIWEKFAVVNFILSRSPQTPPESLAGSGVCFVGNLFRQHFEAASCPIKQQDIDAMV
jgi:hypothetical protein